MTTQFDRLIATLCDEGVEFIIVGGFAGTIHGAARATLDLDVVYRRSAENLARPVRAISAQDPYPRGAPPGLPFKWDLRTLQFGSNFTLRTTLGLIDLLGEITGGGDYERLLPFTKSITVYGRACLCLDLAKLIEVKRAAGRPKDFEAIAELEGLREESEGEPE